MATQVVLEPSRTYITADNARASIARYPMIDQDDSLRYMILQNDQGRYYVAFLGASAVQAGVHHAGFCVVG